MKNKSVLCLAIVGIGAMSAFAVPAIVKYPQDSMFNEFTLEYDPSMVAVTNEDFGGGCQSRFLERRRIMTDLNKDGVDDMILSDPLNCFGTGGGGWFVYFVGDGCWRCIGDVGMNRDAFAFDSVGDEVDLWYYWRSSGCDGTLGYYSFNHEGMKKGCRQISVRFGDDREDSVYGCIYRGIFGYAHNHKYVVEESETSADGTVSWRMVRDWEHPRLKSNIVDLNNEIRELKVEIENERRRADSAESTIRSLTKRLEDSERTQCLIYKERESRQ